MKNNDFPLVSMIMLTYKHERFVSEAIDGALSQDYPNLELIISDDCSPDGTYKIITDKIAKYNGPHKIILNKNDQNLGLLGNRKKAHELAKGDFIFATAGDDVSMPNRVSTCMSVFMSHPEVMSLSSESLKIDENSNPIINTDSQFRGDCVSIYSLADYVSFEGFRMISGESRAIRRCVKDKFPPLQYSPDEDTYTFLRSLYLGSIAYIRQPLVHYRIHNGSMMAERRRNRTIRKTQRFLQRNFSQTGERQIWTDFEYALEKGYIDRQYANMVRWKLEDVIDWLCPKYYTIPQRILRKILRKIIKITKIKL